MTLPRPTSGPPRRVRVTVGGAVALGAALAMGWVAVANSREPPRELEPGRPAEASLAPGERHEHALHLPPDSYLVLVVEKKEVDLALELVSPGGGVLARADGPGGAAVPEVLAVVVEGGGKHRVVISHVRGDGGSYRLRLKERRPAVPADSLRVEGQELYSRGAHLAALPEEDSQRRALALFGRALPHWREVGDAAAEATTHSERGVLQRRLGELAAAEASYLQALELWRGLEEPRHQAVTLGNLGELERHRGRLSKALEHHRRALGLRRAAGDLAGEARTLERLGVVLRLRGEPEAAAEHYQEAAALFQGLGDRVGVARTWVNLGVLNGSLGDQRAAVADYRRALDAVAGGEQPFVEASALYSLAGAHLVLGELEPALSAYHRALDLYRRGGRRLEEAETLAALGSFYAELGEDARATIYHRAALERYSAGDAPRGESDSRLALAWLAARLGRPDEAREHLLALPPVAEEAPWARARRLERLAWTYQELGEQATAAALLERALGEPGVSDPYLQARLHLHLGRLLRGGAPDPARHHLESALATARRHSAPWLEPQALAELAALELAAGNGEVARALVREGVGRARSRPPVFSQELAGPWAADGRALYELAVRVLLLDPDHPPGVGDAAEAFRLSEEARARALEELLARGEVRATRDLGPQEAEERRLRQRLGAQAMAYGELLAAGSPDQEEPLRQQLAFQELLSRHEAVAARLRGGELPAGFDRRGVSIEEAQSLLEPGALLLEYFLGEDASVLWALRHDRWSWHLLPGRAELEDAARSAHRLLAGGREQAEAELARLSALLLAPVAGPLGEARRLAVVPDGALAYLPFAALPVPSTGGDGEAGAATADPGVPLAATLEVVQLPSAGTLAALRRRTARPAPPGLVAVLADPVYSPLDPRLAKATAPTWRALGAPSLAGVRRDRSEGGTSSEPLLGSLRRLRFSRHEAEAVRRAADGGEVWSALDFAASREAATSPELARFRIVHFAAHGVLDAAQPRFSSIVLSLYDPGGRPVDGSLRLHDVYSLRLAADLVVLSGCRTALGRQVRGEGVVGLTSGFLQAGARQVVATLWEVDDRSTAVFMEVFYDALLRRGLPPAAALVAAQRHLRSDPRWRHPSHWAPFVLVGDWAPAS